jgi:hypothetical protein
MESEVIANYSIRVSLVDELFFKREKEECSGDSAHGGKEGSYQINPRGSKIFVVTPDMGNDTRKKS